MRQVSQGTPRRRHAVADGGAHAVGRTGRRGRAARTAHLTEHSPVGVVLAGGASRRFGGTPKGLERVGSTRIIDRVASALRGVTADLLLAANDPAATAW